MKKYLVIFSIFCYIFAISDVSYAKGNDEKPTVKKHVVKKKRHRRRHKAKKHHVKKAVAKVAKPKPVVKKERIDLYAELENPVTVEYLKSKLITGLNQADWSGNTPMLIAMKSQPIDVIEYLVSLGGDLTAINNRKETAIQIAATYNPNLSVLEYVVDKGGNLYKKDSYDSNLFMKAASHNTSIPVVQYLAELGFDINYQNRRGETALIMACHNNKNSDIVEYLLSLHPNVHISDNTHITALMWASAFQTLEIENLLIQLGSNINAADYAGDTVLMYAMKYGRRYENIDLLLQSGVNINKLNREGRNVLYFALRWDYVKPKVSDLDVVKLLVKHKVHVNNIDAFGKSALVYVVVNKRYFRQPQGQLILDYLRKHGARDSHNYYIVVMKFIDKMLNPEQIDVRTMMEKQKLKERLAKKAENSENAD